MGRRVREVARWNLSDARIVAVPCWPTWTAKTMTRPDCRFGGAPIVNMKNHATKLRTKLRPTEADIQEAFTAWLAWNRHRHLALAVAYHIPNGAQANRMGGASKAERAIVVNRLRRMGMRDGIPDYCIPFPGRALYIEFKSESGTISAAQGEMARRLTGLGHDVHFAFSLESAIEVVEKRLRRLRS